MSFLINETLFALSLPGLTECGDFSKSSIQKLMAEADKIAASMPQRSDWVFIKSMATARSEVLTELCAAFWNGDYFVVSAAPLGKVFLKMTKFVNPK